MSYLSLGLSTCFASPNALVPCVLHFFVSSNSTDSEPRAAAATATLFAGFSHGAASVAKGTENSLPHGCWMFDRKLAIEHATRKQSIKRMLDISGQ